jgi:heme A synthase
MTRPPAPIRKTRAPHLMRKGTTLLAVATAVGLWAVAEQALGIEVRSPEMGDNPSADITIVEVAIASLVASLAAWALLAGLERVTRRAHRIWLAVAVTVLVVSLGAPLTGDGIDTANRTVLALLHLAVAVVVIPGMLYPTRSDPTSTATTSSDGNEEVAS